MKMILFYSMDIRKFVSSLLVAFVFAFSFSANATCRFDTVMSYQYLPATAIKELTGRQIFTTNASGLYTSSLYQNWNASTSTWTNSSYETKSYDASGNQIGRIGRTWSTVTASWVNTMRDTYAYVLGNRL